MHSPPKPRRGSDGSLVFDTSFDERLRAQAAAHAHAHANAVASPRTNISAAPPSARTLRNKKLSKEEALLASSRLYEDAYKLAAKRAAATGTAPDGCTFTPSVTSKARKPGVATGQERFEHLYRNAAATQKKLDHEREKLLQQSSTFKPNLRSHSMTSRTGAGAGAGAGSGSGAPSSSTAQETAERLYSHAKRLVERKKELAAKHAEQEEARSRPVVYRARTPVPVRRTPLYSPANMRKKTETLEHEKIAAQLSGCTFKPTLQPRASSVPPPSASSRRPQEDANLPVYERLKRFGDVATAKLEAARAEREVKSLAGMTFQPTISEASRAKVRSASASRGRSLSRQRSGSVASGESGGEEASHDGGAGQGTVFMRLHEESELLKAKLKEKRRQIAAEIGVTFTPTISAKSRKMADMQRSHEKSAVAEARRSKSKDSSRSMFADDDESEGPTVFSRLYSDHSRVADLLQQKREQLAAKEVAECTFKPATNVIARDGPSEEVFTRLYSESQTNAEVHQLWTELRKREELEGCTFRPTVNKSIEVPPFRGKGETVWEWLNKPRKDMEPFKDPEATFKPKVNVKKGQEEPSADAAEVYDRLYANALRSERLRKEVLARIKIQEELSGCTFTPQVNQGYHTGSTGETVHQRLFRHAQHLQEQQRIFEVMKEAEVKMSASPPRAVSRSRSKRSAMARGNVSAGSSEFEDADPVDSGYNTYSYDRRSLPIRWSASSGPTAGAGDQYLFRGQPVDVNHILQEAIDSPPSTGHRD